jgi:hypothetical protein
MNREFAVPAEEPEKRPVQHCPECGYRVSRLSPAYPFCSIHHKTLLEKRRARLEILVSGSNANEVEAVTKSLVAQMATKRLEVERPNPWVSGSFYLTSLVVLVAVFLFVARTIQSITFLVVIIGAFLAIAIVGAFQLRHDRSLSEKNFLSLMALTFKRIPSFTVGERSKR